MSLGRKFVLVVSLAPLFLVGCASFEPVRDVPDPRIDQLISAMDHCLASQGETSTELQGQRQQLALQSQQLETIGRQLTGAGAIAETQERPAAVNCPRPEKGSQKQVVGVREKVWLPDLELALTARMDTGASSASLHAQNIEQFERDGKPWVRFEIPDPDTETPLKFERKLKRTVGVTSSGSEDAERRPVIKLGIVIGRINQTAEFTLYNRGYKTYQLSVGRDILQDVMVVDVSENDVAPYVLPDDQVEREGKTP